MNYTILMYESDADFARRTDPGQRATYVAGWAAYTKALKDAGVFVAGAGLHAPNAGTTLRLTGGQRLVQDGPYADTKEQLGGFCIIDVPNLDAALDWAARCPAAANGAIEVRPALPPLPAQT
jgi:hypothetical protein